MPSFTVVDGDGPSDWNTERARDAFNKLAVEMLRAIGRGDDPEARVLRAMSEFITRAAEASTPSAVIVDEQLGALYDRALCHEPGDSYRDEIRAIMADSVRTLAEAMAQDAAARGRRSQREHDLRRSIEGHVISSEERARSNGWSYLQRITEPLGKWPPPNSRTTAAPVRRKAARKHGTPDAI